MSVKNHALLSTIAEIKKGLITPIKIYRDKLGDKFTIEIHTKEPTAYTSLIYKKESDRDEDFLSLDKAVSEVFDLLPSNPFSTPPLPGPPM